MNVSGDFPGGNIILDSIDGDTVRLHQDLRDTAGDWFYWCFRVAEVSGRAVRFQFTGSRAIGARGPAVSIDGGATWSWLQTGNDPSGFSYFFPEDSEPVFFSMTIPYTEANLTQFLTPWANHPHVRTGILCKSRHGRPVEFLTCGCIDGTASRRVLITARHHCCESLASYALEGLVSVVPDDPWFSQNVEFFILPFMDKDGVEEGDQGKNRKPRDHNRDYDGASLYPETAALREIGAEWNLAPAIMLDLHCPWLLGGMNELIYFVGQQREELWLEQQRFSEVLEKHITGPLPFRASDNLPFGQDWNVESSYKLGTSCARWASMLPGARFVSTLELPYANASGSEVNAASARAFGADLARAIRAYLADTME